MFATPPSLLIAIGTSPGGEGDNLKTRASLLFALIPVFCILFFSCTKKKELTIKTDILKYPSATGRDFYTVLNDSGKVQLIVSGPILEQYENIDYPYTEFRQGIKVIFYNGKPSVQGSVICKYAKYNKTTNIWELKDSVVVKNENNEKLETEVLNWNQTKDLIYTDRFVKITTPELVSQGIGFESDSHLQKRHIRKVSAEITLPDEE
jgi:LPS export ABC transporter protein LptC